MRSPAPKPRFHCPLKRAVRRGARKSFAGSVLDRGFPGFAGADADDVRDRVDEDLAVADGAGAGRFNDRRDGLLDVLLLDAELEVDLGDEPDVHLPAAIPLGVTQLAAEALAFDGGQ